MIIGGDGSALGVDLVCIGIAVPVFCAPVGIPKRGPEA